MITPILSVAQMREWENATWATGVKPAEVIRRVGKLIAGRLMQLTPPGQRILILAGKGHNGDDARAACEEIQNRRTTKLINVDSPATALTEFREVEFDLIVDGLFGIGLNRELSPDWLKLISAINETHVPVVSIDTPSGLGFGAAIHASRTLTVGAVKANLLEPAAADYTGILELLSDIGLIDQQIQTNSHWVTGVPKFPPARKVSTHKGTYGTCGIIAGSRGYHGAAVLAAHGALRTKPGLVHLWTPAYEPVAAQLNMAMVHSWPEDQDILDKCTALLIGPGLVKQPLSEFVVDQWSASTKPLIVDASALDWVPESNFPLGAIRVLTPHPGEAARLLNCTSREIQQNRREAATRISKKFGNCWVVLKGMHTVTTCGDGKFYINGSGNPGLAQGGSGDLLAGYLAGLLAQPELQRTPRETILHAIWQHGAAADLLEQSRPNWTINDLEQILGNVPSL